MSGATSLRRKRDGFLVAFTFGHHGPDHSGDLVGKRNGGDLRPDWETRASASLATDASQTLDAGTPAQHALQQILFSGLHLTFWAISLLALMTFLIALLVPAREFGEQRKT
jgi:hypothetical protein